MKASQNVYLTGDRKRAVAEGDPEARFLLVREGCEIEDAQAEKYEDASELIGKAAKKSEAASDESKVPEKPARKRAAKKAARK